MQRLKQFYDRYKGAVFGYLYRMTGSPDEAEELTAAAAAGAGDPYRFHRDHGHRR